MSITKNCTGCYQSFPLNELELGIVTNLQRNIYVFIVIIHSRYADVDDTATQKTTKSDFCNPLD